MNILRALIIPLVALTACAAGDNANGTRQPAAQASHVATEVVAPGPREDTPSALRDLTATGLPTPLVEPSEIRSGGPPPDGIPSIDEPKFLAVADVDFIADAEPVLVLEIDGDARAYPVQVMMWHEIVNDTVGGVPISVTYCPLCNTAVAVDGRVGDRILTFGTSGSLYQSAMVMYDRQTESLWSHFTAQSIAGVLTGTRLDLWPVATVAWRDFRAAHPDGLVLSRDTGFSRDYGRNPYPGYDDVDNPPFLFDGEIDGRLAVKTRLVGFGLDDDPVAVRLDPLLDAGVIYLDWRGQAVVVWALPGTASALEASGVADGRDVGATGVFEATVNGQDLSFERRGEGFVDNETGSMWTVLGTAMDGPLTGTKLRAIEHVDTFWFAWAAFAPETVILP